MFRQMIKPSVLLLCLIFSSHAFAETAVLLSTDGQGEEKVLVDKVLAEELEAHPDYDLQPIRKIGIEDLILGAGCDAPDAACMEQLSGVVEADRLVFAQLSDGMLSVQMYDFVGKGFIETTSVKVTDEASIKTHFQSILYANTGELFVDVGPENAQIFLNGESQGISPQTLQNLPLGKHTILIRSPDGQEKTRDVVLEAGKVERVTFSMEPLDSGEPSKFVKALPGIGVLALGIAGIGFGVSQTLAASSSSDDIAEEERTNDIFNDNKITSAEEASGGLKTWRELHDKGDQAEVLQWVGYGVGAVGIGLGSYLLFSALGDSAEVAISPSLSEPAASVKIKF